MKITLEMLSIPPYISTTWENVLSLSLTPNGSLRIQLTKGAEYIDIPSLSQEALSTIFTTHAKFLEEKKKPSKEEGAFPFSGAIGFRFPLKSEGGVAEPLMPAMQHNPEQANLPPLPPALLKKIASIAETFGAENLETLPQSKPECNCVFCQVIRAFHSEKKEEEEVTAEDLRFKDWEITQTADQLYFVTNPLNNEEQYRVFLGDPLGCTCGQKNCEHIRAVLKT